MELWIVRHGQTDWNLQSKLQGQADIELNETGITQANDCAFVLQHEQFDFIVTSPLQRAYVTARIIADKLQLPLQVMDEWTERSFGDVEGMTMEERNAKFPSFDYPNAEPFAALQARIETALSKMLLLEGERGLVVAHGAVINALFALLSNGEIGTGKTRIDNGSFSIIKYKNEKWEVFQYNETAHMKR